MEGEFGKVRVKAGDERGDRCSSPDRVDGGLGEDGGHGLGVKCVGLNTHRGTCWTWRVMGRVRGKREISTPARFLPRVPLSGAETGEGARMEED